MAIEIIVHWPHDTDQKDKCRNLNKAFQGVSLRKKMTVLDSSTSYPPNSGKPTATWIITSRQGKDKGIPSGEARHQSRTKGMKVSLVCDSSVQTCDSVVQDEEGKARTRHTRCWHLTRPLIGLPHSEMYREG